MKKKDLDPNSPSNYRPISKLNTISKLLERLAMTRLRNHIEQSPGFSKFQSGFRQHHSTETALLRLLDDVYTNADTGRRSLILQLDLSAAFDMIDHRILIRRLQSTFGISGSVLAWLSSYLTSRHQIVKVGSATSPSSVCSCGVPQGSVLGPLLFSVYVSPLANLIHLNGLSFAQYADDTQLCLSIDGDPNLTPLVGCFDNLQHWFAANEMSLNPNKSEAVIIGTSSRLRAATPVTNIQIADTSIPVSESIRSLGVTLDQTLSLHKHVSDVCRSVYFHTRALRQIRRFLSVDAANALAVASVNSRLDYCNSLLFGTSRQNITRLQRAQNSAARVVAGVSKFAPSSSVLSNLHWLPINSRIKYKVALITYKTLALQQPSYLRDLLNFQQPNRILRSTHHLRLQQGRIRTAFGGRAFRHAAASVWNSLPHYLTDSLNAISINNFKRSLKTDLFITAYAHV